MYLAGLGEVITRFWPAAGECHHPLSLQFQFNPADARFIGSPVDYIIFDGLTEVADEKSRDIRIVFMDVKKGKGTLTRTQRVIKKAVENKAVLWETFTIADT